MQLTLWCRWVSIRVDALGQLFSMSLAFYLVYATPNPDPSNVGFILTMAGMFPSLFIADENPRSATVSFSSMILWWVRIYNEFEGTCYCQCPTKLFTHCCYSQWKQVSTSYLASEYCVLTPYKAWSAFNNTSISRRRWSPKTLEIPRPPGRPAENLSWKICPRVTLL